MEANMPIILWLGLPVLVLGGTWVVYRVAAGESLQALEPQALYRNLITSR
jgi:hypothetical protein